MAGPPIEQALGSKGLDAERGRGWEVPGLGKQGFSG